MKHFRSTKLRFFSYVVRLFTAFAFIFTVATPPLVYAQSPLALPPVGSMVALSPAFTPTILRGLEIDPADPFKFQFIVDRGDNPLTEAELKTESEKVIRYFLAGLAVPEGKLWVNLSPYEGDRVVDEVFGQTEMGRDLLAQDYILKQITASLFSPDGQFGKDFWNKVYKKAFEKFHTTNIPINTFNKVWVIPDKATVYANGNRAMIVESELNVLLEQDYLSIEKNLLNDKFGTQKQEANSTKEISAMSSEIVREAVLPQLRNEVNTGKNFAQLRQVYHSLILANWFKENLKQAILNKVYSDKNKVGAISIEDKEAAKKIYDRYLVAFKKGVYDFMKVEYDPYMKKSVPRKYFSGGFDLDVHPKTIQNPADISSDAIGLYESMKKRLFKVNTFIGGKVSQAVVEAKKNIVAISLAALMGFMAISPLAQANTNSNMKTVINYTETTSDIKVAPVGLLDYVPTSVVDEANKTVFGEFVLGDVTRSANTSSLEQNIITFYTSATNMKVGTLTTMYYKTDKELKYKLNLSPEFSKRSFSERTFNSEDEILAAMDAALLTSGSQADFISRVETKMGKSEAFGEKVLNLSLDPKDIKAFKDSLSSYNFRPSYSIKVIDNTIGTPIGEIQVRPKAFGTGYPIIEYRVVIVKNGEIKVALPENNALTQPVPNIKDFLAGKSMPTAGWTQFIPGDKNDEANFSTAVKFFREEHPKGKTGDKIFNAEEKTNTPLRNELIRTMKIYDLNARVNAYDELLNPDESQITTTMDSARNVLVVVNKTRDNAIPDTVVVKDENVVKTVQRGSVPAIVFIGDNSGTMIKIKYDAEKISMKEVMAYIAEKFPGVPLYYDEVNTGEINLRRVSPESFSTGIDNGTFLSGEKGEKATYLMEKMIAAADTLPIGGIIFAVGDLTPDYADYAINPLTLAQLKPLFEKLTKIMEEKNLTFIGHDTKDGTPGETKDLITLMNEYNTANGKRFFIETGTYADIKQTFEKNSNVMTKNIDVTAPSKQMSNINSFEIGLFKGGTLLSAVNPLGVSVTGDNFLEENLPDGVVPTGTVYKNPSTGAIQGLEFPSGAKEAKITFYNVENKAPLKGGQDTVAHKRFYVVDATSSLSGDGDDIKLLLDGLIDSNTVGMTVFKEEGNFKTTTVDDDPSVDFKKNVRSIVFRSPNTDFATPFSDAINKAIKHQEGELEVIKERIKEEAKRDGKTLTDEEIKEQANEALPPLDIVTMTDFVNLAKKVDLKSDIEKLMALKIQVMFIVKRTNYDKAFMDVSSIPIRSENDIISDGTTQSMFELTALTDLNPEDGPNFYGETNSMDQSLRDFIVKQGLSGKVKIPENGMQKVIKVVFTNEDRTQTTKYYQVEDLPAGTNQDGSELMPQGGTYNGLMKGYGPADYFGWVEKQVAQQVEAVKADVGPSSSSALSEAPQAKAPDSKAEYGGIDFNADKFKTQTKGSGIDMNVPFDENMLKDFNPDGVSPVIIQIVPILNPQSLLGLADEKPQDFKGQVSQNDEAKEKKSGSRYPTGNYALQATETAFLAIS